MSTLRKFLADMAKAKGGVYSPSALLAAVCKTAPRFRSRRQQDAFEVLKALLSGLHEEERQGQQPQGGSNVHQRKGGGQGQSETTFIEDMFGGFLASTVTCARCKAESTVRESFFDLSLPLPEAVLASYERRMLAGRRHSTCRDTLVAPTRAGGGRGSNVDKSVSKCLEYFTAPETLQGYHCGEYVAYWSTHTHTHIHTFFRVLRPTRGSDQTIPCRHCAEGTHTMIRISFLHIDSLQSSVFPFQTLIAGQAHMRIFVIWWYVLVFEYCIHPKTTSPGRIHHRF
jgi:uncharacterized CHY-type Zn-finger protein